jgi:hypothetical protein
MMADPEKIVFLSPSDFQLGDVMFKAGLYQVQQIDEGQEHILVFTRVVSAGVEFTPQPWMAEVTM